MNLSRLLFCGVIALLAASLTSFVIAPKLFPDSNQFFIFLVVYPWALLFARDLTTPHSTNDAIAPKEEKQ